MEEKEWGWEIEKGGGGGGKWREEGEDIYQEAEKVDRWGFLFR